MVQWRTSCYYMYILQTNSRKQSSVSSTREFSETKISIFRSVTRWPTIFYFQTITKQLKIQSFFSTRGTKAVHLSKLGGHDQEIHMKIHCWVLYDNLCKVSTFFRVSGLAFFPSLVFLPITLALSVLWKLSLYCCIVHILIYYVLFVGFCFCLGEVHRAECKKNIYSNQFQINKIFIFNNTNFVFTVSWSSR
jgi:hypothetical protein